MNIKLCGKFKLLSPLSHIGESISTVSYLVQEPILQESGVIEEVFCYSGNAWRGQLRDLCAIDFLEKTGIKPNQNGFHMLFSGGKIGGDQAINIEKAKEIREMIPMFGLFGGGVGNQLIPGKMKVSNIYPACKESQRIIDESLFVSLPNYSDLVFEKSFSRKDDEKDCRLSKFISGEIEERKESDVASQMRMTSELIAAGSELYTEIYLSGVNEIDIGSLFAGISRFNDLPFIGGQSNKGHGKCELEYFCEINGDKQHVTKSGRMSKFANKLIDKYKEFVANSDISKCAAFLGA